jgi:hypothetical protein
MSDTANSPPDASLHDPVLFGIKEGYRANLRPEYFRDDRLDGITWQPDLYPLVASLARALGCRQILDVGCGQAGKLHGFWPEFDIVGLDYGDNLALCRARYPYGRWIEIDLEKPEPPRDLVPQRSAIVCGDVIEHLIDPRPLLAFFRSLLEASPFVAVSTPERDLRRGVSHVGPPLNPCHVREWTLSELAAFCVSTGMRVAWSGLTTDNSASRALTTALVILVRQACDAVVESTIREIATTHVPAHQRS